ncbi:hypothetical protein [Paenibacillus pini]|uniref:Chromosome segregation ATPase n=1 Tax=Paenibacillus pini JCM 16418 TaxID=1236976 RepID=W7YY47_9BACL|nr:hypothetical protein [Paenibacillus pini]GAF07354.1 hypothetical protein JCM16418_1366 [Paenibacillus pini JCM 16418]
MSAINAFRATNVKYNKQQFVMDNLYLSFANDTDLVHALATMPNGYGKGVILQSIFQIFKPLKDWQKGKGRVSQFFHSTSGFNPYTLYSALEWKLDVAEGRFLITGIAISARRVKEDDSGPKTDVYYKLFTIKCDSSSDHRLANLPYWDEETGESWPLSKWEDYAKEFPQQIRLYNKDELRKYRSYLQENGIFADEWDEMYEINQNEAGTTIYFEKLGADHNDGLFRKVIIPSIESNLRRQVSKEGRDLKELFIEVAKIAHNLNTLLSRKSAMTGILGMLEDVDAVYLKLQEAEKELNNHAQRGSYLKSGLLERIEEAERDLDTLEKERQEADDAEIDARFNLKNLTYIEDQYKISEQGKMIREMKAILETETSNASEIKRLMDEADPAIIRKEYEEASRNLDITLSQIKSLMMREQLTDVKAQQEELEKNIENEWPSLLQDLSQTVNHAVGYQSVLNTNIQMAESELTELHKEISDLSKEIGTTEERIRVFQTKLNETYTRHNLTDHFTFSQLIKMTGEDYQKFIESIEQEEEVHQLLSQQCADLEREKVKLETKVEHEEAYIHLLNDRYNKQLNLEVDAAIKLQPFSGSSLPWQQEKYVVWLQEQLPELTAEASRREQILRREEEDIRRLESEHMITEGGFWVPNSTILQLRDVIKSHGYTCLLGTEFIQERSEVEQESLRQNAKLLPYGLIILENEREQVLHLTDFKNRILFYPVPLFSVEIIDNMSAPTFITVPNRSEEIAFNPAVLESYLAESEEEVVRRREKLGLAITEIKNLKSALKLTEKALDSDKSAEQLGEECQALEDACERKKKQINDYKSDIEDLQSKIAIVRNTLQKSQKELKEIETKMNALEDLNISWVEHQLNEKKMNELNGSEELAKAKIQKISSNKQATQQELEEQKKLYSDWKNSIQQELNRYREAIPSLSVFDFQLNEPSFFPPSSWPTIPLSLEDNFNNWSICQKTLEQASSEMTRLETFKAIYAKQQEEKRRELIELDEKWANKVPPTESLDVLKQRRKQFAEEFETADLKRQQYVVKLTDLQSTERAMITYAEKLKVDIEKEFKQREVDFRSGIDVDYQRKEFNYKLSQANEKLKNARNSISDTYKKKLIWEQSSEALQHLSESKHRVPREVYFEVGTDAKSTVRDWVTRASILDKELRYVNTRCSDAVKDVQKRIKEAKWDDEMKQHGEDFFDSLLDIGEAIHVRLKISEAKYIYEGIIEREEENLNQAQEAELRWVQTATEHSRQIINHIHEMVKGMSIRNRYNISFPLMKLKEESMPRIEDVEGRMKDLFRQTLRF